MVYITLVDFKLRSKYTQVIVWRNNRCKSRRWQNDITINQQQPQIYTDVSFYMAYFIDLILSLLELASLWNILNWFHRDPSYGIVTHIWQWHTFDWCCCIARVSQCQWVYSKTVLIYNICMGLFWYVVATLFLIEPCYQCTNIIHCYFICSKCR